MTTRLADTNQQDPKAQYKRPVRRRAKKSLGQHFLHDEEVVRKIADALQISESDTVVEIGAGRGILTSALAERARRVVAVELDDRLAAQLHVQFDGTNVDVVHGDALELDPHTLVAEESYLLAGNLPYNVAQPLLRHYLESQAQPQRMVVMVQSEVADSIVAKPGRMSLLSVAVQLYGAPRLQFRVPSSAFRPPPKVRSAVVRIDITPGLRAPVDDTEAFFHVVRAGFSTRRKQLRNGLAHGLRIDTATVDDLLRDADINPKLRPQALSLADWAALEHAWTRRGQPEGER